MVGIGRIGMKRAGEWGEGQGGREWVREDTRRRWQGLVGKCENVREDKTRSDTMGEEVGVPREEDDEGW